MFATVTLVSERDASLSSTFRVPITAETSVRQLAKDAMRRLVMTRFSHAMDSKELPAFLVSEVRVDGLGPHNAEIFARDLVTQVVLVREEVIYMRLQLTHRSGTHTNNEGGVPCSHSSANTLAAAAAVAAAALPSSAHTVEQLTEASTAAAVLPGPVLERAPCPAPALREKAVNVPRSGRKDTNVGTAAEPPAARESRLATKRLREDSAAGPTEVRDGAEAQSKKPAEGESGRNRPAGWGSEAANYFPQNYCSSPERLMRKARATVKRQGARSLAAEEKQSGVVKVASRPEPSSGRGTEGRPAGWGPEAYKSFPANYVSSPDRLAREIRKQRREEERSRRAAGAGAGAGAMVAAPVAVEQGETARRLQYEDEGHRDTVGHQVDSVVIVEDETPKEATADTKAPAPLPEGWGCEATKYFDPATYCDDPRKAKMSIASCPRSVRPHRTPPSTL